MSRIFRLICCIFVIAWRMETVQGAVYSTPDTAIRFSQCLTRKMSETRFFSLEDGNSMTEVADIMAQAMVPRERAVVPPKILLMSFITSMADIVILEDISKNGFRKEIYTRALEDCSVSSTGYIDPEFISEAMRIMSSIEGDKLTVRNIFNPNPIQPSPAQNPYVPGFFNPNLRTNFERSRNPYPPIMVSSQSNIQPGYRIPFSTRAPFFPSSYASGMSQSHSFAFGPGASTISQSGSFVLGPGASSMSSSGSFSSNIDTIGLPKIGGFSPINNGGDVPQFGRIFLNSNPVVPDYGSTFFTDLSPSNVFKDDSGLSFTAAPQPSLGGLNIPQTKDSSVVVIPPMIDQYSLQGDNPPVNPMPETPDIMYQPSSTKNPQQSQESAIFMSRPTSVPQTNEKDLKLPNNRTMETTILNILINSTAFKDLFNPLVPQQDAINLALIITQQSFDGYDIYIINEALTAVSGEVAKVIYGSPENYALALSNAIGSVFKLSNPSLSADVSKIAKSFIFNLENARQLSSQAGYFGEKTNIYVPSENASPERKENPVNFQSPPLPPEDTGKALFSEVLTRYLLRSNKLANFFCNRNAQAESIKIYFTIVKASLIDYGPQISAIAASIASSLLMELSQEELCFTYAKKISDVIADVLDENGIQGANAEVISNKMEVSLSQQEGTGIETQKTEDSSPSTASRNTGIVPYETVQTLQPSFSTTFEPSQSLSSSRSTISDASMTQTVQDATQETSNDEGKYDDIVPTSYSTPLSSTRMSSDKETLSEDQINTEDTNPDEFFDATVLEETVTGSLEASSTENSVEWAPGGIVDQEALEEYLFDAFQSALNAYSENDGQEKSSSGSLKDISATTKTVTNSGNDNLQTSPEEIRPTTTEVNQSTNSQTTQRRKRETTESSVITTPSVENETSDEENDRPDSEEPYAEISYFELQPSFQGPSSQTEDFSSIETLQSNSDVLPSDFSERDESVKLARTVSQIAVSSIDYIRSNDFEIFNLCNMLNKLAPLVNIPPLNKCEQTAVTDYVLNVLLSMTRILGGV